MRKEARNIPKGYAEGVIVTYCWPQYGLGGNPTSQQQAEIALVSHMLKLMIRQRWTTPQWYTDNVHKCNTKATRGASDMVWRACGGEFLGPGSTRSTQASQASPRPVPLRGIFLGHVGDRKNEGRALCLQSMLSFCWSPLILPGTKEPSNCTWIIVPPDHSVESTRR